jgi:hypothetical protein
MDVVFLYAHLRQDDHCLLLALQVQLIELAGLVEPPVRLRTLPLNRINPLYDHLQLEHVQDSRLALSRSRSVRRQILHVSRHP